MYYRERSKLLFALRTKSVYKLRAKTASGRRMGAGEIGREYEVSHLCRVYVILCTNFMIYNRAPTLWGRLREPQELDAEGKGEKQVSIPLGGGEARAACLWLLLEDPDTEPWMELAMVPRSSLPESSAPWASPASVMSHPLGLQLLMPPTSTPLPDLRPRWKCPASTSTC